jgi:hypothetical protein
MKYRNLYHGALNIKLLMLRPPGQYVTDKVTSSGAKRENKTKREICHWCNVNPIQYNCYILQQNVGAIVDMNMVCQWTVIPADK